MAMNWFRAFVARRRLDRDLADEIAQHLDEKVDALVAAGHWRVATPSSPRAAPSATSR